MKQVIVVRKDLNMRKGKIASQVAHASMAAILNLGETITGGDSEKYLVIPLNKIEDWLLGSFTKIVVGVDSEEELLNLYHAAVELGNITALIKDEGRTEFHGVPTYTALAIGPGHYADIDFLTRELKLL